jgi:heat shock protein HslJ
MTSRTIAALACAAVLASTGHGFAQQRQSGIPAVQVGKEKVFPTDTTWIALTLNGKSMPFAEPPTMRIDENYRAKGFSGCNTFSVTAYPMRQQKFAVGPFALTKKACPKPVMDAERSFLIALRTIAEWDLEGANVLILKGPNGTLRFQRGL